VVRKENTEKTAFVIEGTLGSIERGVGWKKVSIQKNGSFNNREKTRRLGYQRGMWIEGSSVKISGQLGVRLEKKGVIGIQAIRQFRFKG